MTYFFLVREQIRYQIRGLIVLSISIVFDIAGRYRNMKCSKGNELFIFNVCVLVNVFRLV